ncbi:MAG TPA: DUF1080 domain-containing protein [Verrucomicrobiae bacterium]
MKSLFAPVFALLFVTGIPLLAQNDSAITPTNRIDLFDGKTLSGWTFVSKDTNAPAEAIWSTTNGMIRCLGKPYGYARTLQHYHDYQLHAEWRFPVAPGNSGVFLHLNPPDKVWPYCYEAQLLSGDAGEVRMNGGSKADGTTSEHHFVPRQQASSEKPIGEWNTYDITCRSDTIIVKVNGVLQNTITGTSTNAGTIGLQAEGGLIEFRNIYLEPLPAN